MYPSADTASAPLYDGKRQAIGIVANTIVRVTSGIWTICDGK